MYRDVGVQWSFMYLLIEMSVASAPSGSYCDFKILPVEKPHTFEYRNIHVHHRSACRPPHMQVVVMPDQAIDAKEKSIDPLRHYIKGSR